MPSRKSPTESATGMKARLETLEKKAYESKKDILEQLSKTPVVIAAIQASGVARSTYYKWRKEDTDFARLSDDAIKEGRKFVNDIAVSKLMQLINAGSITAIIFWLKNNHTWFAEKIRYEHNHSHEHHLVGDGVMTPEQREQIVEALRVSGREEAIRRHELLAKIFLAEKDSSSSEKNRPQEETATNEVADDNRVSDLAADKPSKQTRKEFKRNGVNIEAFLKDRKKT